MHACVCVLCLLATGHVCVSLQRACVRSMYVYGQNSAVARVIVMRKYMCKGAHVMMQNKDTKHRNEHAHCVRVYHIHMYLPMYLETLQQNRKFTLGVQGVLNKGCLISNFEKLHILRVNGHGHGHGKTI
jgi:hypothetical protein